MKQDLRADKMPKESPKGDKSVTEDFGGEASEATEGSLVRGLSNTPAPRGFNCSVDYLSVTFDGTFDVRDARFGRLFEILELNINDFLVMKSGFHGYEDGYQWDEDVFISSGGQSTLNKLGEETCSLELKGGACRHFETRVTLAKGSFGDEVKAYFDIWDGWRRLLKQIDDMGGRCSRIDLPTDDFSGFLPYLTVKQKIYDKQFTTNLRRFSLDADAPKLQDHDQTVESKAQGFTATFGSSDKTQLCIYNKAAEILAKKGGTINTLQWVRFEVRFFHKNAVTAMDGLYQALREGKPMDFIVSVLAGCFSFKEPRTDAEKRDMRHAPVWENWKNFIGTVKATSIGSIVTNTSTFETQMAWFIKDAGKILAKLVSIYHQDGIEALKMIACNSATKLDVPDLIIINNFCREHKIQPIACLDDVVKAVNETAKTHGKIDPGLEAILNTSFLRLGTRKIALPQEGTPASTDADDV